MTAKSTKPTVKATKAVATTKKLTSSARTKAASETQHHPLAHLIPNQVRYDQYSGRKIGGVSDLEVLQQAFDGRHNVAIYGPTGCAKTTLVYALGYLLGLPVFSMPCNGAADPSFIFGGYQPNADGTFTLRPGPGYYIAKYGGIWLLDEFNFLPPRIGAVMHGCLDSRRMMVIPEFAGATDLDAMGNPIESIFKLHPKCMFVATWNPGYAGTYAMNAAMLNRFGHKFRFDYMRSVENELCESGHLLDMADALRKAVNAGTLRTPISTNSLMEFEEFAKNETLGIGYASENFLNMFSEDERKTVSEVLANYIDKITVDLMSDEEYSVLNDGPDDDDFDDDDDDEEDN